MLYYTTHIIKNIKNWTWTLDLDPDPKNLDPEKPGTNIGLKNMSDFR